MENEKKEMKKKLIKEIEEEARKEIFDALWFGKTSLRAQAQNEKDEEYIKNRTRLRIYTIKKLLNYRKKRIKNILQ